MHYVHHITCWWGRTWKRKPVYLANAILKSCKTIIMCIVMDDVCFDHFHCLTFYDAKQLVSGSYRFYLLFLPALLCQSVMPQCSYCKYYKALIITAMNSPDLITIFHSSSWQVNMQQQHQRNQIQAHKTPIYRCALCVCVCVCVKRDSLHLSKNIYFFMHAFKWFACMVVSAKVCYSLRVCICVSRNEVYWFFIRANSYIHLQARKDLENAHEKNEE